MYQGMYLAGSVAPRTISGPSWAVVPTTEKKKLEECFLVERNLILFDLIGLVEEPASSRAPFRGESRVTTTFGSSYIVTFLFLTLMIL